MQQWEQDRIASTRQNLRALQLFLLDGEFIQIGAQEVTRTTVTQIDAEHSRDVIVHLHSVVIPHLKLARRDCYLVRTSRRLIIFQSVNRSQFEGLERTRGDETKNSGWLATAWSMSFSHCIFLQRPGCRRSESWWPNKEKCMLQLQFSFESNVFC